MERVSSLVLPPRLRRPHKILVRQNFFDLGELLGNHQVSVRSVIALTYQRGQLGVQQLARMVDNPRRIFELVVVNAQHRAQHGPFHFIRRRRLDECFHLIPLAQHPRRACRELGHALPLLSARDGPYLSCAVGGRHAGGECIALHGRHWERFSRQRHEAHRTPVAVVLPFRVVRRRPHGPGPRGALFFQTIRRILLHIVLVSILLGCL